MSVASGLPSTVSLGAAEIGHNGWESLAELQKSTPGTSHKVCMYVAAVPPLYALRKAAHLLQMHILRMSQLHLSNHVLETVCTLSSVTHSARNGKSAMISGTDTK